MSTKRLSNNFKNGMEKRNVMTLLMKVLKNGEIHIKLKDVLNVKFL